MQYFILTGMSYSTQNRLAEDIQNFLEGVTNILIDDKEGFKDSINNAIKMFNEKYPRCKPVKPSWFNPESGTTTLHFGEEYRIANLSIYEVKEQDETLFINS